jgi:putative ABC transport system ATP-binding protein
MLIEIKDLTKNYLSGEVETNVLHGINFNVAKGEFLSIMGPSGSGKSTLMHILGLLDRPSGGVYKFNGHNVTTLDDNELATLRNEKIGFVFQAFNLLPRTTVLENVKLPLLYSKKKIDADARARAVLESVGLGPRLQYFTNQISGGEKQRVAIARALVNDPEIIFADEPTGNLDSKSGIQVMEIFQKLNDEGHTIILVTHETATAEYADRIIRVRDGEIIGDDKVINKRRGEGNGILK